MDGQMQCVQLCFPWNCKMMTSLKAKGRLKDDYIKPKGWTILDLFIFDLKTLLLFCDWKTSSLVQKQTCWLHSCKESCQQKKDLDHSNKQTKILLIWARGKKTPPEIQEHCSKVGVQLPRNNLCRLGVAESVLKSLREYFCQLLSVTFLVSVHCTYSIR